MNRLDTSNLSREEIEFLDNLFNLLLSFSSEKFNKPFILELLKVTDIEASKHGDRAVISVDNMYNIFKETKI